MCWNLQDDVEAEMKRLKLELKQTMDMYSTACKEALTAKQKVTGSFSTAFPYKSPNTFLNMSFAVGNGAPPVEDAR